MSTLKSVVIPVRVCVSTKSLDEGDKYVNFAPFRKTSASPGAATKSPGTDIVKLL